MNYNYYDLYKQCKDSFFIRLEMVKYEREYGVVATAQEFKTTNKTVRKWVKRYHDLGNRGLRDFSKKPINSPNKISNEWEAVLIKEVEKRIRLNKRLIIAHIKKKLNIPYSLTTLLKTLRRNKLLKHRRKKYQRKRDLREIKKQYKAFEKLQIDVKYLDDIPEFYLAYKKYDLPRYQITARCIKTGGLFISYMYYNTVVNSSIFIYKLQKHLQKHGVDISKVGIQTDNGSEFIKQHSLNESMFTRIITEVMQSKHYRIPPGAKTWQSDVESSHRLIEDEFYSDASIYSQNGFFRQAYEYQKQFNFIRENKYKGGTPLHLLKEEMPNVPNKILKFKPIVLDDNRKVLKNIKKLIA